MYHTIVENYECQYLPNVCDYKGKCYEIGSIYTKITFAIITNQIYT